MDGDVVMKPFGFFIRRKHGLSYEKIVIFAENSSDAINKLPPCVSWNFVTSLSETLFGN